MLPTGPEWAYHVLKAEDETTGYIIQTERLAPRVYGFGGPIHMALLVSMNGELQDFRILQHYETPSYIGSLDRWFNRLIGKTLWGESVLERVQAVSGATYTTEAVIEILQRSGHHFARAALGLEPGAGIAQTRPPKRHALDTGGILLAALILLSLLVAARGGFRLRLALLGLTVIGCGLWLNLQFSTEQVVSLLAGRVPPLGLTGHFILGLGLPVLLLFFGNLYCGYLCPFGALQELLGMIWPRTWTFSPARETLQRLRFGKYFILFLVVFLYFTAGNRSLMNGDPLVWFFKRHALREWGTALASLAFWPRLASILAALAVLVGVLLSTRFWCRTLCPTGAFLSLSNRVCFLRRWRPDYRYGRCEFGLTGRDELDCLACDRCRFGPAGPLPVPAEKASRRQRIQGRVLALLVVLVAVLWLRPVVQPLIQPVAATVGQSLQNGDAVGRPRTVDMIQLQERIQTGRLSDREALYYRVLGDQGDPNERLSE
jgi:hypothetical protein